MVWHRPKAIDCGGFEGCWDVVMLGNDWLPTEGGVNMLRYSLDWAIEVMWGLIDSPCDLSMVWPLSSAGKAMRGCVPWCWASCSGCEMVGKVGLWCVVSEKFFVKKV